MSKEDTIVVHAEIALLDIKDSLKGKWDSLSSEHKRSAIRSIRRMVELEYEKRTTDKDVSEDLAFVKTTVDGFRLAGEIALYDAFWKGVNKALEALGSFLIGAGKSLVPGLESLFNGIDIKGLING